MVTTNDPVISACEIPSCNVTMVEIVVFPSPTHILPSGKLGTSFVLSIDETIIDPFVLSTLPILPTFCIRFVAPVGLVIVRPPPDFMYIVSLEVVDVPSITSVVKPESNPVIIAFPSPLLERVCSNNPSAGVFVLSLASAAETVILPEAPTVPVA